MTQFNVCGKGCIINDKSTVMGRGALKMSKETMLLLQGRKKLEIARVRSDWARETPQD